MSKRAPMLLLLLGVVSYCALIGPFTSYMRSKPVEEKLGYIPSVKLMKPLSADQKEVAAASLVFKVLMYYGGMVGRTPQGAVIVQPTDVAGMSRVLHAAVQLDPYNMDAYYFAQGILTWDAKQFKVANDLLIYGMKYRNWDWFLPFFAAFNYAYFLNDYPKAAYYYNLAGDLSGEPLYKSLASRYLQESGRTDLAIGYLVGMVKSAKTPSIRRSFEVRLQAFEELRRIEIARDRFIAQHKSTPASVQQLVQGGYLKPAPVDPYGGTFYLQPDGKVACTSKFAFGGKTRQGK